MYQTPVPAQFSGGFADRIVEISARLSSTDRRFEEFAKALEVDVAPISMKERLELTAELNALVAKHYGLGREELEVILESFEGFKEDKNLEKLTEVKWGDDLVRRFNGEVRKRVLQYFDSPDLGGGV